MMALMPENCWNSIRARAIKNGLTYTPWKLSSIRLILYNFNDYVVHICWALFCLRGSTTFSITLSIMAFNIKILSIMILGIMILGIMICSIMICSIMILSIMILSIMILSIMTLSIITLSTL